MGINSSEMVKSAGRLSQFREVVCLLNGRSVLKRGFVRETTMVGNDDNNLYREGINCS